MAIRKRWISCGILLVLAVCCASSAYRENLKGAAVEGFCLEAHRGLSNSYPENTLASFRAAAARSEYQGIETDVQETSDGALVLYHDSKLDKRTDAEGKIGDYTFEQVQEIRIDNAANVELYPDERIPALVDYLEICRQYGKIPYIELKSISIEGMKKLISILKEGGWDKSCVITTFNKEYVQMFRSLDTGYPVEFMISKGKAYDIREVVEFLSSYENMLFRPNAYEVTEEQVRFCNENGIGVEAFGLKVGDKETLERLKQMNVRGVTCNDYIGLQ